MRIVYGLRRKCSGSVTSAAETANGIPGAVVRTFYRGVLCLGMSSCFTVDTLDVVAFTTVRKVRP